MAILGLTQTGTTLGRQRAARVRRDARVIDQALGNAQLSTLAETALHLAAEIIEQAGSRDDDPVPLSDEERAAFARFGIDTSKAMPREAMLQTEPVVRGMRRHAQMVATAVPIASAARRLGVDPSRLRQRIREGTLLAVRRPQGRGWLIPAFQLTEGGEIPHLARVLAAAQRHLSPLSVARAFELPHEELDDLSPRDWLISGGDPAPVERIIAGF
jgi:hypothetical protein